MPVNNLQNLINSVDIATIFLDRGFKINLYSPAAKEIFDLQSTDYGRALSDITSTLAYDGINSDLEVVLDKLEAVEKEVYTIDNRAFMMRVLPYRTEEDTIDGVVITFFDITRRKQAENAMKKSEERYRLLVESAKDYAIFTADVNRRVNSWNSGAEVMFGYTEQEIMGELGDIFFTPEDRKQKAPEIEAQKAMTEGKAENERWHMRKDGSRFYGSGMVRPLYDDEQCLLGFVKIMRDLTESKKAEDALRQSIKQKDEFIGIASHELKTPLTSIKIYAETLLSKFGHLDTQEALLLIQKLNGQLDRLTNLVHDLLDTTKVFEGNLSLYKESFFISELIKERIEDCEQMANGHQITLTGKDEFPIFADRERIGQVVTNLIANAIKYSPVGGLITITVNSMDQAVEVSIRDHGIGIPNELLDKIFLRFFRVNDPKMQTYPGMGLGLYISAGIIERHSGAMSVESEYGKGSTFSFSIPYGESNI